MGLEAVADPHRLRTAWEDVLASDREDGVLGAGMSRFARDADERLTELSAELLEGSYRLGLLTQVAIPKEDGSSRLLHLPPVRDRIVERALLAVVGSVIDPWLGPWAFAYRPGLGVADAVQAVAGLRDEGLSWVARTDVADCFPSIPVGLLRRQVRVLIGDDGLLSLIELLLHRRSTGTTRPRPGPDCHGADLRRRLRHLR
jgi:retron-type reverse transcriptase